MKKEYQNKLNNFYNERSAHYEEIATAHPGCPDDCEMHWGQILDEIWNPREDALIDEIEAAGFRMKYNQESGRMEIL